MEDHEGSAIFQERQAKQQYLFEEIINKNHNSDLFLEFCEKKKSSNIDDWSFPELEACVKDFIAQTSKPLKDIPLLFNPSPPKPQPKQINQPVPAQASPSFTDSLQSTFGYSNDSTITVQTIELTDLARLHNVKIIVCNPEFIDPGFFSAKFYCFAVNTLPLNWMVKRKIEEFLWLREALVNSFPGVLIPPIHKSNKSKIEEKGLFKRQVLYSNFLNNAAADPLIRTNAYFIAFLKETDFKSTLKNYKKPGKIKEISEIRSLEGEIMCVYDEVTEKYEKLNAFLVKCDRILGELLEKFKKLIVDYVLFADSLTNYANLIKELKQNYAEINNETGMSIFYHIESTLESWAENSIKSTKFVYEDIKIPLKYYRMEMNNLSELIRERDGLLMSIKGSKGNLSALKDIFGYYNYQCLYYAKKNIKIALDQIKNRLVQSFTRKSEDSVEFHLIWGNLMSNLTIFKE